MVAPQSKRNEKPYRNGSSAPVLGISVSVGSAIARWTAAVSPTFSTMQKKFLQCFISIQWLFSQDIAKLPTTFFFLHLFHRIMFAVHRFDNKGQVKNHFRMRTQAERIRACKLRVHFISQICILTKHKGFSVCQKRIKHINVAVCLRITMYVYYCYDFFICSNCNFCLKSSLVFAYRWMFILISTGYLESTSWKLVLYNISEVTECCSSASP